MPARILDGVSIAASITNELAGDISRLKAEGTTPGLAAVLVGEDPASQIYVHSKVKKCESLGLYSEFLKLDAAVSTQAVLDLVAELNARHDIDGILVQLPLPPQVDVQAVTSAVDPAKDVDGLHPLNAGKLAAGQAGLVPCTPAGIIQILDRSAIKIAGTRAVVIGRSRMVGLPLALLLLQRHATVTICHSRTEDLAHIASQADILTAAVGRPGFVSWDYIKEGATVIDVGTSRLTTPGQVREIFHEPQEPLERLAAKGSLLIGDVQPEDAREKAGAYTPVPGGVGPLTIAMLMSNTVRAARLRRAAS